MGSSASISAMVGTGQAGVSPQQSRRTSASGDEEEPQQVCVVVGLFCVF